MTTDASGPNPFAVTWSALLAMRHRPPAPHGTGTTSHHELAAVLDALRAGGVPALSEERGLLAAYRHRMQAIDPDGLTHNDALAYWLNLYNAGALDLAAETFARGEVSVLRVPGAFRRPWATIGSEELSLDAIEHGKIRRFKDPRIHAALVCGSASCPTLRFEPYAADGLDHQLDDQLRRFFAEGGVVVDRNDTTIYLSRILLWYGADFVRPHRMPAWIPASPHRIADAIEHWVTDEVRSWMGTTHPTVAFQPYDWSLACSVSTSRRASHADDH